MYEVNPVGMLCHLASRIDICNRHGNGLASFLYHKNELSVL